MNEFRNNKINILEVKIDQITTKEVLDKIENFLESDSGHYIATVNPEMIIAAQKDKKFQEIINNADIAIADGIGLLWASKFLQLTVNNKQLTIIKRIYQLIYSSLSLIFYPKYCREILPEQISGVDLIYKICQKFQNSNYSIFLLGARQGVVNRAGDRLKKIYPNLKIAGVDSSIIIRNSLKATLANIAFKHNDNIIKKINKTKPDILFVAFGTPKQEKWIAENLEKIPSVKLAIGVGGSFDFISGRVKRAPKIVRRIGLEWLWRFLLQPWRAKRIFTATIVFGWKVFWNG